MKKKQSVSKKTDKRVLTKTAGKKKTKKTKSNAYVGIEVFGEFSTKKL